MKKNILESKFIEWSIKIIVVAIILFLSSYYIIRVSLNMMEPDFVTSILIVSVNILASVVSTIFITKYLSKKAFTKSQKKHAQTTMRYVRDNLGIQAKALTKVNEMIYLSSLSHEDIQILESIKEKIQISRQSLLNSLKDIRDIVSEELIEEKETIEDIFESQNEMIDVIREKQELQKEYKQLKDEHDKLNSNLLETKEKMKKDQEAKKGLKEEKDKLSNKLKEVEDALNESTIKLENSQDRLEEKESKIKELNTELVNKSNSLTYSNLSGIVSTSDLSDFVTRSNSANKISLRNYGEPFDSVSIKGNSAYTKYIDTDSPIEYNDSLYNPIIGVIGLGEDKKKSN